MIIELKDGEYHILTLALFLSESVWVVMENPSGLLADNFGAIENLENALVLSSGGTEFARLSNLPKEEGNIDNGEAVIVQPLLERKLNVTWHINGVFDIPITEALARVSLLERVNNFMNNKEMRLQLHEKRYESFEAAYRLIVGIIATLNGGALFAVITSGLLSAKDEKFDPAFASAFVVGCIFILVSTYFNYLFKRSLLDNIRTYFLDFSIHFERNKEPLGWSKNYMWWSLVFAFFSIIAFTVGGLWGLTQV